MFENSKQDTVCSRFYGFCSVLQNNDVFTLICTENVVGKIVFLIFLFQQNRFTSSVKGMLLWNPPTQEQHGLFPSGNLTNMHKIGKFASVGFNSQLLANT